MGALILAMERCENTAVAREGLSWRTFHLLMLHDRRDLCAVTQLAMPLMLSLSASQVKYRCEIEEMVKRMALRSSS